MNSKFKSTLIVIAAMIVGAEVSYFLFNIGAPKSAGDLRPRDVKVTKSSVRGNVKKITEISLVDNGGRKSVRIVESSQVRPGAAAAMPGFDDDVEEENLTEVQKDILKELQDALDADDIRRVRKALSRFTAKVGEGGLEGRVPVCMRAKAVEALGWFGKDAALDLMPFVADANNDVSSDAFAQWESSVSDNEMSDVERSEDLCALFRCISDGEHIDSALSQLNDMRNSVKAETARKILSSGSEKAKTVLIEQLESYFDEGVKDVEDINRWEKMNPDDPDDPEFYGKK